MMRFESKIMIYPWIRGRQPTAKVLLVLITYEVISAHMPRNDDIKIQEVMNVPICLLSLPVPASGLVNKVKRDS